MNKKLIFLVFALGFIACNQREESKANTDLLYFDINGYFKKEAVRLKKLNPQIVKEVSVNDVSETQTLKLTDWEKELAIFINADINKASWKGSFNMDKKFELEHYTSSSKKIPIKDVVINTLNNKVKKVQIIISNKNILYTSSDTLIYYPDSLYQIKKYQKIKLLMAKSYHILGKFK
ncbi:hypothetical protein [Pedobacter mendelii]|uniref:Uncharacterized protein n=1 Tax=Pedobacter mendelii TaxID=1908240 RepID=A0ABQ2BGH4_9SPHI|nr:hypothetical protein [Pedobacter mendelii]GGI25080.1 hypothetical protein GCM10008119_15880 [Pedobacter mendelii]